MLLQFISNVNKTKEMIEKTYDYYPFVFKSIFNFEKKTREIAADTCFFMLDCDHDSKDAKDV